MSKETLTEASIRNDSISLLLWSAMASKVCETETFEDNAWVTLFNLPADTTFPFAVEVKLVVNGTEVDFRPQLERLIVDRDEWITKRAIELVSEKTAGVWEALQEVESKLRELVQDHNQGQT